ncbi:MAG: DEAD/DEAH box helicase [Eubacteriales bacterium]|nr:DEAD/DEAH box helicase [Eubacteriales bacterium]
MRSADFAVAIAFTGVICYKCLVDYFFYLIIKTGDFMTFQELNIMPAILRSLRDENYSRPTPIQAQAIPPIIAGRDLLGIAQTGTGKTAAFAVPILQNLAKASLSDSSGDARGRLDERSRDTDTTRGRKSGVAGGHVRALILTPTRELALQIFDNLCVYGSNMRLRIGVIFGGVSQRPQEQVLARGVDVLVATPGRLKDLMNQGLVHLDGVEILTLDEADRMLDMGFAHDVKYIIAKTPKERQTLFFSATMPKEIVQLTRSILRDPVRVSITPDSPTVDKISQTLYMVNKKSKFGLLEHLLAGGTVSASAGTAVGKSVRSSAGMDVGVSSNSSASTGTAVGNGANSSAGMDVSALSSVLVFTRTKHGADRVVRDLNRHGVSAQAIHGNKSQNARQLALSNFKDRKIRVLVATDIAARGIDIDELSHVINYDLPEVPESYVHRIGRTGRAGHEGVAISFCDVEETKALRDIERLCGRSIPRIENHPFVPGSEPVATANTNSASNDGVSRYGSNRGGNNRGNNTNRGSNYRCGANRDGTNRGGNYRGGNNRSNSINRSDDNRSGASRYASTSSNGTNQDNSNRGGASRNASTNSNGTRRFGRPAMKNRDRDERSTTNGRVEFGQRNERSASAANGRGERTTTKTRSEFGERRSPSTPTNNSRNTQNRRRQPIAIGVNRPMERV